MNVASPKAYTIPDVNSMPATVKNPLHLPPLEDKAILVDFEGGRLSSDGGLILLGDPDDQIGLTRELAEVLRDPRDPRRIDFTNHDLLKQRVFQLVAGYEDANDANPPGPTFAAGHGSLLASNRPHLLWSSRNGAF